MGEVIDLRDAVNNEEDDMLSGLMKIVGKKLHPFRESSDGTNYLIPLYDSFYSSGPYNPAA